MKKIVKYFNSLVEETILKHKNKTNKFFTNNSKISNFNKILISFICLLFIYLFFLSIPSLYDKTWVQRSIEDKLLKDYNIEFSTSSDIIYNILPAPHFLVKNSKIFRNEKEKSKVFSEIKKLKVFIDQNNFFDKNNIRINRISINEANFFLKDSDFKLFNTKSENILFNKKIKINNSNIFFKSKNDETIVMLKLPKAILCCHDKEFLNSIKLNLEVFKIPFTLNFDNKDLPKKKKKFNIKAKKIELNILNESQKLENNSITGLNITSFIGSKIYTKFKIKENSVIFESNNARTRSSNLGYSGILSTKPFDLKIDINLKEYNLSKLFDINSIVGELIKTKLLFNKNVSAKISVNILSNKNKEIFESSKIKLNIINGKINFDNTKLVNNKIGNLKLINSDLFFENDRLILNTDIKLTIKDYKKLYSVFQTPKHIRKPIKTISVNLDYDLLGDQINVNRIMIDGNESNDEMMNLIQKINYGSYYNFNKSKRTFNQLFYAYAG